MVTYLSTTFFKIVNLSAVFFRQVPKLLKSCCFSLAPQTPPRLSQESFHSLAL